MWNSLEVAKLLAALVSPAVTIMGFWFIWQQLKKTNQQIRIAGDGLEASNSQNKINQDWKRAEFIAAEMKEFSRDPSVVMVMQMIDYTDRSYYLGMKDKDGEPLLTRVTHRQAALDALEASGRLKKVASFAAIETALATSGGFSVEEAAIRDSFDVFLSYIERFEQFIKLKLISEAEIFPYLRYCIRMIQGKVRHVEPGMLSAFRAYLKAFHFEDAEHFFYERFPEMETQTSR